MIAYRVANLPDTAVVSVIIVEIIHLHLSIGIEIKKSKKVKFLIGIQTLTCPSLPYPIVCIVRAYESKTNYLQKETFGRSQLFEKQYLMKSKILCVYQYYQFLLLSLLNVLTLWGMEQMVLGGFLVVHTTHRVFDKK